METIRKLRVIQTGHTLTLFDTYTVSNHHRILGYKFEDKDGKVIFEGLDFGCSMCHSIDSDNAVLSLMTFLTLKPGDTDQEYFDKYTEDQMNWATSNDCENLACDMCCIDEDLDSDDMGFDQVFEDLDFE